MLNIPDDPIIACMERTGYPPWHFGCGSGWPLIGGRNDGYDDRYDDEEDEEDGEEEDEYFFDQGVTKTEHPQEKVTETRNRRDGEGHE